MKQTKLERALAPDLTPRTFAQLREHAHEATIRAALARGDLTRLVPDQYCLTLHADSWIMRSRAAVEWAGPHAALTGLAALAAWRYAPVPIEQIQVAVPSGAHRSGPPWITVRSLTMPIDTATWHPKTQLTKPELALVLGYAKVPLRHRAKFVHNAVRAGLIAAQSTRDLAGVLTRIPAKRELIQRLDLIAAGAESYLEERGMTTVFYGPEFEDIIYQHRVRVRGQGFRIDAFHAPTLTAFELDGDETHDEPPDRKRDLRRDALLATVGIQTVRLASKDVFDRPSWCHELALETVSARANRG